VDADVYAVFLPARITLADSDVGVLVHAERRRMAAYRRPDDAVTYAQAHVMLRQLLSERIGVAPEDLRFRRDACPTCGEPRGRPIVNHDLHEKVEFSLSRGLSCHALVIAGRTAGIYIELEPPPSVVAELTGLLHHAEK
jgi:4'-phosphopantetheinyl transferase